MLVLGTQISPVHAFGNSGGTTGGNTGVFGSLELKADEVHGGKQWNHVLRRIAGERSVYHNCDDNLSGCPTKVRAWRSSIRSMDQLSGWNLLAAVNSRINTLVKFRNDIDNYGQVDHWASPVEALTGQGDCEDFAILKYISLLELGISDEQMRIVVVKDVRRGTGHAILSVAIGDQTYILDNLARTPVLHTKLTQYVPYYSVNGRGKWLNIATRERDTL